jgi:hypothetical protein
MGRPGQQLAEPLDGVELGGLGRGLERDPDPMGRADVADLAHRRRGAGKVPFSQIGRAHHGGSAQGPRPAAGFGHRGEEPRALGGVGEHPAQLAAHARHRKPARAHQVEDGVRRLAGLGGPGEVESPELDRGPPGDSRGAERVGQGRGVERPGVEREAMTHFGVRPRLSPAGASRPALGSGPALRQRAPSPFSGV